jgi:hypothetical protein
VTDKGTARLDDIRRRWPTPPQTGSGKDIHFLLELVDRLGGLLAQNAVPAGMREEWAITDTSAVDLGQWPTDDHDSLYFNSREDAETHYVGDDMDVVLRRITTGWVVVSATDKEWLWGHRESVRKEAG